MSYDFDQLWGDDINLNSSGRPLIVEGTTKGEQRVYRRLMTNPGDYLWHPAYGAGLPRYVGQSLHFTELEAVIRRQLAFEAVVAPQPVPVVLLREILNGVIVTIRWVDRDTGNNAALQFDLKDG